MAIAAMLELVVGRDSPGAPRTTLWFSIPAVAILVVCRSSRAGASRSPRRRPTGCSPAALSFVDGRLVPFIDSLFLRRDGRRVPAREPARRAQARIGLAIVLGGAAIVVYNIPDHRPRELVFIPLVFGIAWLAGYARAARRRERAAERRRRARRDRPSGSARRRPASPSPRSARGSRASSTTSSPTRSA